MGRRRKCRFVADVPAVTVFKPQGVPMGQLYGVVLGLDGFEAMRLVDGEGLSQEEAASLMQVSRPTLCRILAEARTQVARALSRGWAIRIEVDGEHTVTRVNGEENMAPYCRRAQGCAGDGGQKQERRLCEQDKADEPDKPDRVREAGEVRVARVARGREVRAEDVEDGEQAPGREL
ncbi:MAG: DUF134 domain-containing protein [Proteobacteria bacterium]|nr:DUF134 domain-containing protein [Pseudomonadota bacterium]MBU4570872.1 DUF134 domain-containing protein [Pseudomonadota bacterium]MBU4595362.1 DUF134 domain-containing protein [Pseudomonadota bacterium]